MRSRSPRPLPAHAPLAAPGAHTARGQQQASLALTQAGPLGLRLEVGTARRSVAEAASTLVASLPVADITTEAPPLEEIIGATYCDQAPVAHAGSP